MTKGTLVMANSIRSGPGFVFALIIACLSEPSPALPADVTTNVAATPLSMPAQSSSKAAQSRTDFKTETEVDNWII